MKKILIFTVHAGGGHISATQALQDYLQFDYEIKSFSLFKQVITWVDPIAFITLWYFTLDDCYNFFVLKKHNRLINLMAKIGIFVYPMFHFFVKKLVFNSIKKENPDLIISVIPIVNGSIGFAAQQLKIPFIIVPTDLDTSWFTKNFSLTFYKHFMFTLSFDDPMIWQKIDKAHISRDNIKITGFPLRKSFFEPKNVSGIKKDFNIPKNKPVLMILMGAIGNNAIIKYLQEIKKIAIPLHIIICLGKNEQLAKKIERISFSQNVTFSIIGFTDKIADLMAVSDLLLTKSGSVSVCEAIYMNLPLILDNTEVSLDWEQFNVDFVKAHGFGEVITSYTDTAILLQKYLDDHDYLKKIKRNIENFKKDFFGKNIKELIKSYVN